MSVAWTTILIIVLLLPGVFFFTGFATRERYSREIVRSSAIGDIGWAILVAIIIHLVAYFVLSWAKVDVAFHIKQIVDYQTMHQWQLVDNAIKRIVPIAVYVIATAISGLLLGCIFAWIVQRGWLPFLTTHKWINVVMGSMRKGLVTAYIMTTTKENKRILMYKGVLAEFYLSPDGRFVYVILKACSRYYMNFEDDAPVTSKQLELFSKGQADRSWDYLMIDGVNIANILFDPSPEIVTTDEGEKALKAALEALSQALKNYPINGPPPGSAFIPPNAQ